MNYAVTLRHTENDTVDDVTVIVDTVMLDSELIILGQFDPSFCPKAMQEGIRFHSAGLKASIWPDSPIAVLGVEPTNEPVPEPEVFY